MSSDIADIALATAGRNRMDWALAEMPVMRQLMERFRAQQPFAGTRVSGCLHITAETGNLARTLQVGGADVVFCASNPLSTQDDVAAALVRDFEIPVFAVHGEDTERYYAHIRAALDHEPMITLDDGADLVTELHTNRRSQLPDVLGSMEETTTGVIRLRAMATAGVLSLPVIAVNDAMTKHLFDNRYGTGQSALDGIIRATNMLIAGKVFTVVGYGWCGRGLAMRARGHGARVVVCEVETVSALEAAMDGYEVMRIEDAAAISDFMVTVTGNKHAVAGRHLEVMKDGCVLANAGHFDVEVNIPALESMARQTRQLRDEVKEYELIDGRCIRLLSQGRLVNLAAAEGHPASVMDMSFANQALCAEFLARKRGELEIGVHRVPAEIDAEVARLKLDSMGIAIDSLTDEQRAYLSAWKEGT